MWPYKNHNEEDYEKTIEFVEQYAVSLGAKLVDTKIEEFTTIAGDNVIEESSKMNIYMFDGLYFWVEHHFVPEKPFIVLSFGESIDDIFDDADPFPYDLPEEELKKEVRYSLGLEE